MEEQNQQPEQQPTPQPEKSKRNYKYVILQFFYYIASLLIFIASITILYSYIMSDDIWLGGGDAWDGYSLAQYYSYILLIIGYLIALPILIFYQKVTGMKFFKSKLWWIFFLPILIFLIIMFFIFV